MKVNTDVAGISENTTSVGEINGGGLTNIPTLLLQINFIRLQSGKVVLPRIFKNASSKLKNIINKQSKQLLY